MERSYYGLIRGNALACLEGLSKITKQIIIIGSLQAAGRNWNLPRTKEFYPLNHTVSGNLKIFPAVHPPLESIMLFHVTAMQHFSSLQVQTRTKHLPTCHIVLAFTSAPQLP